MKSNFEFLRRYWPALAEIGATAEGYLFTDPNSCIFKLGMFGERVVSEIFAVEHLRTPEADDSQAGRIRILKREGLGRRGPWRALEFLQSPPAGRGAGFYRRRS